MAKLNLLVPVLVATLTTAACGPVPADTPGARADEVEAAPATGLRAPERVARPTPVISRSRITVDVPKDTVEPEECVVDGSPRVVLFTSTKPGSDAPSGTVRDYSIYSTVSIFVGAFLDNVCGRHQATVQIYAPDGSLYKETFLDFNAEGSGTQAVRVSGGYLVGTMLPIAGTAITNRPILGTWSVNFDIETLPDVKELGLFRTAIQ